MDLTHDERKLLTKVLSEAIHTWTTILPLFSGQYHDVMQQRLDTAMVLYHRLMDLPDIPKLDK